MYVDGFVLPVPADARQAYKAHAEKCWPIFREYGALTMMECWGDDVPHGKINSFHTSVMLEDGEVAVFSWMTWPDKATRDAGWQKMMEDPRMKEMSADSMPFDGRRMIFGGFEPLVSVAA